MRCGFFLLLCLIFGFEQRTNAQPNGCTFLPPFFRLHFGRGDVRDINASEPEQYRRLSSSCPPDGFYTYTSFTSDCFSGDWHTLTEDHTPGDADGNMLLVNSAYAGGEFFSTAVSGFKPATVYQFGVWLMNLCRPTRKCPFPLLPNLLIRLQTPSGKTVAQFSTGELTRVENPQWAEHKARFTTPAAETTLLLTFVNTAPGGCGNDFAVDDVSFSECKKPVPVKPVAPKPSIKKEAAKPAVAPVPVAKRNRIATVAKSDRSVPAGNLPLAAPKQTTVAVPDVLRQRTNKLVERFEAPAGEIQLDLYDNGEIDGDTVSVYHNNRLLASQQRLSQKPVSFRIRVDKEQPHHELIMVANNLGSIPPNTSLMMITAGGKRHQVYISSTEQQNAKLVIALKEQ